MTTSKIADSTNTKSPLCSHSLSNGQLYYSLAIILMVLNGFLFQSATTPEHFHSLIVTNVQLWVAALSLSILLRDRGPKS